MLVVLLLYVCLSICLPWFFAYIYIIYIHIFVYTYSAIILIPCCCYVRTNAEPCAAKVFLKAKHLQGSTTEAVDMLRGSGLQRLVARSVYKEAYEQSLVDCQGASAPCMVQSHQAQVQASERTPAVAKMVNSLRDLNAKHPQHQPLNQPK